MDLSFSGAGFMGCYYFGVVDCWNKYIPRDRINRVAGASAGSLIAAYYLLDLPLSECLKEIVEMTEDIRKRPLGVFDRSNQIVDILPKKLDSMFPDDAHKKVSGRLHVVMTRLKDMKKVIVNEFETKKDLLDALNCSCFIPVWSGNHVSTYQGVKHIDGGFSDNLPVFDEHTIRVCCFAGQSDISPYDRAQKELLSGTVLNTPLYFTFSNLKRGKTALFPPPAYQIVQLVERGFHDTKDFILTNDLIQCQSCYMKTKPYEQAIYSKLSPTITPSVSPTLSRRNFAATTTLDVDASAGTDAGGCKDSKRSSGGDVKKKSKKTKGASGDVSTSTETATNNIKSFDELLQEKLDEYSPETKHIVRGIGKHHLQQVPKVKITPDTDLNNNINITEEDGSSNIPTTTPVIVVNVDEDDDAATTTTTTTTNNNSSSSSSSSHQTKPPRKAAATTPI